MAWIQTGTFTSQVSLSYDNFEMGCHRKLHTQLKNAVKNVGGGGARGKNIPTLLSLSLVSKYLHCAATLLVAVDWSSRPVVVAVLPCGEAACWPAAAAAASDARAAAGYTPAGPAAWYWAAAAR